MKDFFGSDIAKLAVPKPSDVSKLMFGSSTNLITEYAKNYKQFYDSQQNNISFLQSDLVKIAASIKIQQNINHYSNPFSGIQTQVSEMLKAKQPDFGSQIKNLPKSALSSLTMISSFAQQVSTLRLRETINELGYSEYTSLEEAEIIDENKDIINDLFDDISQKPRDEIEALIENEELGTHFFTMFLQKCSAIDRKKIIVLWMVYEAIILFVFSNAYSKYLSDTSTEEIIVNNDDNTKLIIEKTEDVENSLIVEIGGLDDNNEKRKEDVEEHLNNIDDKLENIEEELDEGLGELEKKMDNQFDELKKIVLESVKEIPNKNSE